MSGRQPQFAGRITPWLGVVLSRQELGLGLERKARRVALSKAWERKAGFLLVPASPPKG
jgi:hypothetical protein